MILATIASGLIGAASAQAGTLTVYATPSRGCNLFTANGGGSHFVAVPLCIGSPAIAIVGGGPTAPAAAGARIGLQTTAPPGITINSVIASPFAMVNINNGKGWGGGSYWAGGGNGWSAGAPAEIDGPFSSSYWGFQMICGWSSCPNSGEIALNTIQLTATENQGPGLTALGAHNLWYQTGRWIWNAPGDPWPITLAASDPSGVCNTWATVNNVTLPGPSASPDTSQWQQCPEPTWTTGQGATVDTRDYIPGAGQFPLALGAANAAGVPSQVSETLNVDNLPVAASFTTPNDANPSVWVNHPVTLDATASAGPSGIGGMNCSTDGASAKAYPAGGVTVNGDGVHAVSCTAWNNAIDPEGSPATGTGSITVHIDEAPPSVSFESQDPADPAHLIVDTADSESGVAGGTIQMAPAGTNNWASLPTSFDSRHLLADVNDSGLSGTYTLRATSCDNVGNCASTDENLGLPLRLAAVSEVSFIKIHASAITARERVLVGWQYKRVRRHHKLLSVRTGGHYITVRIVIRKNTACAHKRIQTGRRRWREITACRRLKIKTLTSERVAYGKSATVHGLLLSAQGFRSPTSLSKSSPHPTTGLGSSPLSPQ